jgi:hypothetical protein
MRQKVRVDLPVCLYSGGITVRLPCPCRLRSPRMGGNRRYALPLPDEFWKLVANLAEFDGIWRDLTGLAKQNPCSIFNLFE